MSDKKTTTTNSQTQQNTAWAPAEPYLEQGVQGIGDWMSGAGATSYQGPRVADLSQTTQTALDRLRESKGAQTSSNYYNDVLSGNWLDQGAGNPYMERLQDATRAAVMPSINSMFSANGLVGSTAHQGTATREMGRAMAEPLFRAYESERSRMDNAAGQLPQVDQIINGNYLQAGNVMDQHSQLLVDAQQAQWEADRAAPVRGYMEGLPTINQLGTQYGTQTSNGTSTSRQHTPWAQQALGAAMGIGGLMSGMGGLGALGGAMGSMIGSTDPGTAANGGWNTTTTPTMAGLPNYWKY